MRTDHLREQFALEKNVVVMGLTSMFATFGNTLWFYFLPIYYTVVFNATAFQIALIYAVWLAIAALGSAPAGALADAYGRKIIVIISSLVSAIAVFIFAFSNNFILSAIALPISGLGSSFFKVANTLVAESVEPGRRGTAFGTYSTMSSFAAAFSPLIGGLTISRSGYFPLFLVGAIMTLLAALARALYLEETLAKSERTQVSGKKVSSYYSGMRSVFSDKLLLTLVLIYSMYNLFVDQNSFVTSLYAKQVLGFDEVGLGILFTVLLVVVAVSRLPFGKLSDRIGRKKTVIISWIGEITLVYIFVFPPGGMPSIAIFGMAIWMIFGVMDGPAINAWVADVSDSKRRGFSMGVFYSATFLPTVFALLVTGFLFMLKPQYPFYANSLIGVVALVMLVKFAKSSGNAGSTTSRLTTEDIST